MRKNNKVYSFNFVNFVYLFFQTLQQSMFVFLGDQATMQDE